MYMRVYKYTYIYIYVYKYIYIHVCMNVVSVYNVYEYCKCI